MPNKATIPAAGSVAPDFTLPSQDGTPVALKDFRDKWVVLYFYPKDFTSGCTVEARNFQRDLAEYERNGAVVLGVNLDSADSHKRFCTKEGLGFTLLADTDQAVSRAYGSLQNFLVMQVASRHTFLIDPQGKIAKVFTTVNTGSHSEEVLAALAELRQQRRG